jgi:hypothetical protein
MKLTVPVETVTPVGSLTVTVSVVFAASVATERAVRVLTVWLWPGATTRKRAKTAAKNDPRLIVAVKFHFLMLFDCKLIRPVLCSFPTGFLINTQLYLCGAKSAMRREK